MASTYEWLTRLPDYLDRWGIDWIGYGDWETHAAGYPPARNFTPVGLVNHHTAGTDDYPVSRLTNKCNLYIDPDGTVWVLSLGYQYDTGFVDRRVLADMQSGRPPRKAADQSEADRVLGNQWFIDIEVGHWGLGQPIPDRQRAALIRTNAAIMDMMGWNPYVNLNDHKGLTRRKIDVNWVVPGRGIDTIEWIRDDTAAVLAAGPEGDMWIQSIDDATWTAWYRDGHIEGDPALLPDYFFASNPGCSDVERIHAFNVAQRSMSGRKAGGTVPAMETVTVFAPART